MKLHENKSLFSDAVRATAEEMQIAEIFIEKDYWVTLALRAIFESEAGEYAIFKGGTSLSKCFGIIERFSEDIDLVVLYKAGESANSKTNKIKKIGEVVTAIMPEVKIESLTVKRGMNRKTAHEYAKLFEGDFGQARDKVVVEATWLGYFEPHRTMSISPFIYDMMIKKGQENLAKEYDIRPFDVKVLDPKRTICEKIMSLVRFSYAEDSIPELKKKVRHIYDLSQLLKQEELSTFFDAEDFTEMLLKVGKDDVESYKNNNKWLAAHPNESMLFKDCENVWKALQGTYENDFRKLVFRGAIPPAAEMLQNLLRIRERLAKVNWSISL